MTLQDLIVLTTDANKICKILNNALLKAEADRAGWTAWVKQELDLYVNSVQDIDACGGYIQAARRLPTPTSPTIPTIPPITAIPESTR